MELRIGHLLGKKQSTTTPKVRQLVRGTTGITRQIDYHQHLIISSLMNGLINLFRYEFVVKSSLILLGYHTG